MNENKPAHRPIFTYIVVAKNKKAPRKSYLTNVMFLSKYQKITYPLKMFINSVHVL
jgi:hypothetical protein